MLTKTKISGLAVGSVLAVGTSPSASVGESKIAKLEVPVAILPAAVVGIDLDVSEAGMRPIKLQLDPSTSLEEWSKENARRFRILTAKRAQLIATLDEEREFAELQQKRRAAVAFASGVDALSEWRRRRFARELLTLLSKNATFLNSSDKEKLRAFGQTPKS